MPDSEAPAAGIGHNKPSTADILSDQFAQLIKEVDDLATRANTARDQLGESAEIGSEDQAPDFVDIGVKAGKLSKKLNSARLETTEPLRTQTAETNRFFDTMKERADRIKTAFEEIVGRHQRKVQEAERKRAAEEAEAARQEAARRLDEASAADHSVAGDVAFNEAAAAEKEAQARTAAAHKAGSGPTRTEHCTVSGRKSFSFRITNAAEVPLEKLRPYMSITDIEKALRAYVRANKDTMPLPGVEIFEETRTQFRG